MALSPRGSATASVLELPVTFRPMARDDLANIFDRVLAVSQNVATAERFVRRIRNITNLFGRGRDYEGFYATDEERRP